MANSGTYSTAGKRILITGASSGVGAALARKLALGNAVVGLIARRRDRLEAVLADCRRSSPASQMWVGDLADTAVVEQLALRAWEGLGGIDVLVNNAAIPKRRMVTRLDPSAVEAVMRVNF
ncbi:MAG: SDR family NAD(P)-dependent oxidoreductase, partial [Mycobacterium sp.]|nr:SDR family NAD(P)-dependent oxidoreductase [Mycobacterium sp.]